MHSKLIALSLLATVSSSCLASAATYEATFTGTVNSPDSFDPVTGAATPVFTLMFSYVVDPSKVVTTATSTTFTDTLGGETASISIDGGVPVTFTSNGVFQVSARNSAGSSSFQAELPFANNGSLAAVFTRDDGSIPNSVTTSIPTLAADGGIPGNISNYIGGFIFLDPSNPDNDIIDDLFPFSLRVQEIGFSSVPLPASAPMFGAALLALGVFSYGTSRKKAASAA